MSMSDQPPMICGVCSGALDTLIDDNGAHYIHNLNDPDDHEPTPTPAPADWRGRCDFCNSTRPTHVLPADDFRVPGTVGEMSRGGWAACDECAELIRDDRWRALEARVAVVHYRRHGFGLPQPIRRANRSLYRRLRLAVTGTIRPLDAGSDHA